MRRLIKKLLEKLNIILALTLAVVMAGGLSGTIYVLADNTASQSATSAAATTIEVVGKIADTAVTTITFPEGAPSATVSNPSNQVDGTGDAQVLHATTSEPVVRLKNTSAGALNISLSISSWTGSIAASEGYALSDPATTTTSAVTDNNLSTDGTNGLSPVATGVSVSAGAYKALYLELILTANAGASGTSTLTVLGET